MSAVHDIVIGMGFGDEGKGKIVDYLCSKGDVKAVIRFSGGAQAAHNVVTPDGRHHTFSQFGSGSFHGVPTFLSQYMMLNPFNLMVEADALRQKVGYEPLDLLRVHPDMLVTTPYHVLANRLNAETLGHGSCGEGIGETRRLAEQEGLLVQVRDLRRPDQRLYDQLMAIREYYLYAGTAQFSGAFAAHAGDNWELTKNYYRVDPSLHWYQTSDLELLLDQDDGRKCVFEGSQGVLLDEKYGFNPHTTWSTTTNENALSLLGRRESRTIGVTRTYMTRHGAGPLPSESLRVSFAESTPEAHNEGSGYQGRWRRGFLDLPLLRYAAQSCQPDVVALTHMDTPIYPPVDRYQKGKTTYRTVAPRGRTADEVKASKRLGQVSTLDAVWSTDPLGPDTLELAVTDALGAPVVIKSWGKTFESTSG